MNYEEILKRVMNGESTDVIAKEMTDMLNKANAEKKAADAKREAETVKDAKLNNIAKTLTAAINEYALVAGVEDVKLETAEVRQMLDEFLPIIEEFKDVKIHVAKKGPMKAVKAVKKSDKPEDVFAWFFNNLGI